MRIDIVTLFPEMFASVLGSSILKRAAQKPAERTGYSPATTADGRAPVSYHLHDIRLFAGNKHEKVDKPPYGGGPGMVIQCQPTWDCVQAAEREGRQSFGAEMAEPGVEGKTGETGETEETAASGSFQPLRIHLTPQGKPLDQSMAERLSREPWLLMLCGHYEGFDQRVLDRLAPMEEISLGDFVLSGGELAAMVLIDAVVRLVPGVVGDSESILHESFSAGHGQRVGELASRGVGGDIQEDAGAERLLDYPHYTRPAEWEGMPVPAILLSGDHAKIAQWRHEQALERTRTRRPDLLDEKSPFKAR